MRRPTGSRRLARPPHRNPPSSQLAHSPNAHPHITRTAPKRHHRYSTPHGTTARSLGTCSDSLARCPGEAQPVNQQPTPTDWVELLSKLLLLILQMLDLRSRLFQLRPHPVERKSPAPEPPVQSLLFLLALVEVLVRRVLPCVPTVLNAQTRASTPLAPKPAPRPSLGSLAVPP